MGYQAISLDKMKSTKPDIAVDIMEWKFWEFFKPGEFELIAASVPCNEYSQAKNIGIRDMDSADKLVEKTLEIIAYLQPKMVDSKS